MEIILSVRVGLHMFHRQGELEAFAERWVYGRGCPRIEAAFAYNRKRNCLELALRQEGNPSSWVSARSAGSIGTRDGTGVGVLKVRLEVEKYRVRAGSAVVPLVCRFSSFVGVRRAEGRLVGRVSTSR